MGGRQMGGSRMENGRTGNKGIGSGELGVGLIGAWGFRWRLARYACDVDSGVRVIGAADVYDDALAKFREQFGEDTFSTTDYTELLARDDLDAVFVNSPDFCHEEHAVAALEAGKAVYLEKPIAITLEGADRILTTAMKTGSKLYLGHNMRYFPAILKMKEIIDSGLIGEIKAAWCRHFVSYGGDAYFKDWHSERKHVTGLLLQKGAHDIDVIHWLCGGYTRAVSGMGMLSVYDRCDRREPDDRRQVRFERQNWPPESNSGLSPVIDVEDHAMMLMELDNGVQASYLQCHFTPDAHRNYTFIGTRGRIENMGDSGKCMVAAYTTRTDDYEEPDIFYNLRPMEGSHGGSDPAIVRSFLNFIRFGEIPNTSPVAARNAVAAGIAATESLRGDGGRRTVPPVTPEIDEYFGDGQQKRG